MVVITAKIYAGKISHQKNRDQDIFYPCVVLIIILNQLLYYGSNIYIFCVLATEEPESASYLLGDYALMHGISCTDTLSLSSVYQNEFSSVEGTRLAFFDMHLLVIDHEALRKDFVLDVAVLVLRSFRNDVAVLNKQLSPSVVLLDPRIYRRHRNLLREKWEALHVNVINLS